MPLRDGEGGEGGKERCCSWRRWNGEINLAKRDGRADVFHILLSHLFSFLARSLGGGAASRIIHLNSDLRSSLSLSVVLILAESGGTRTTPAIVRTAISCVRATCITLRESVARRRLGAPPARPPPCLAHQQRQGVAQVASFRKRARSTRTRLIIPMFVLARVP